MSPKQNEEVVARIKKLIEELPENYTGRFVVGIDFQSGGIGNGGRVRVTADVRVPMVGPVSAA